ncbi:hypothetical protein X557_05855 [Francisella tularensis subsp. holarctica PHIT-FT049]|nr:hypothetical protein X557_05855 [Francisella tularensis subsp. holarctica PHIT-FT049]BCL52398.1 hypothetical protein JPFTNV_02830 [Francisella tularensis subsp. holarctica]BCL55748.1 hypothetical protein JPFTKU_15620 [Francisella tularensis subsp. holarctica]
MSLKSWLYDGIFIRHYNISTNIFRINYNCASNSKYFTQHNLNYIAAENHAVSQYWLDFYSEYGLKVPQGQPGSHPNNLSLDDKFTYKAFLK